MSKWSSFEKQQLLTESWRKFLNEAPVVPGATPAPAPAQGAQSAGNEMSAKLKGDYPAFVQWLGGNIKDPKPSVIGRPMPNFQTQVNTGCLFVNTG